MCMCISLFVILEIIFVFMILIIFRIYLFIMKNLNILGKFDKWIFLKWFLIYL